jgi:hypothetical protein
MGHSSSESNLYHASPVEIRPLPKAGARREIRRRKTRASAVLTDTPVKVALDAEVEARARRLNVRGYSVAAKTSQENTVTCTL